MLVLQIIIYSVAVWLGLYSLSRDPASTSLRANAAAQLILAGLIAAGIILEFSTLFGVIVMLVSLVVFAAGIYAIVQDGRMKRESLVPELIRSFDYAMIVAALFGIQVVIVMAISTGATPAVLALLLAVIGTAIALQVFLNQVQSALDRIALVRFPGLRSERAELREIASALPKIDREVAPLEFDEDEFLRHTRRALTNFGDLSKLTVSPLVQLPLVTARMNEREAEPTTLERAVMLKELLAEGIEQLRPRGDSMFGTSDEWRYFNSLYFPYVLGIKSYSRRADNAFDDEDAQLALDWFRTYVPERTLHNWQTAGARLVAGHLREQSQVVVALDPIRTPETVHAD